VKLISDERGISPSGRYVMKVQEDVA